MGIILDHARDYTILFCDFADTVRVNTEQVLLNMLGGNFDISPLTGVDSRRRESRVPQAPELVRIANENGEYIPVVAHIANMSKSGIGLKTSKALHLLPGTPLVVELRSLLLTCVVRYFQHSNLATGPYELGLKVESVERIF